MSRNERVVVVYHKNCHDGMTAAWVCSRYFGKETVFFPMAYGEPPQNLDFIREDDELVFVDFSMREHQMLSLAMKCKHLLVIDHHKTAQDELKNLKRHNIEVIFDMKESGASLTWKQFFPRKEIPNLVKYVKDRDLWNWSEVSSREINSFIDVFEMNLIEYDRLYHILESDDGLINATIVGNGINRYKEQTVKVICANHTMMNICGHIAAVTNTPILMSDVGHELSKIQGAEFGAYYFDRGDGIVQWGARSIGDFDVSNIARKLGGGGHKNAAGWELSAAEHYEVIKSKLLED